MVGWNIFSPTDLIYYTEEMLKEIKLQEISAVPSNYSWLKARSWQSERQSLDKHLEKLKPMIYKMSAESCASIAVKLDKVTDQITTTSDILLTLEKLLQEEYSAQLIASNVRRAKETKNGNRKLNRVHPDLSPDSRRPTVSFIL